MIATLEVLIVGAGPTGLTLACELARRNVSFRIIEASPGPQAGSRGKGLQPRSLEVFDDLGIVDQILANGQMAMPIVSTAPDGIRVASGEPLPQPRHDVPYAVSVITPQWRVEEALRARLASFGASVEFDSQLVSFSQSDGCVSTILVQAGSTQTLTSSWLIGCDGGHSTVRKQAQINFVGETLDDVRMIVADVEVAGLDRNAWRMWRHAEGFVSICPLPSTNLFQYQASIAPGQDPTLSIENMAIILRRRSGSEDFPLQQLAWSSLWRANVRIVDRYRDGRVILAGDAAHIHSPAGGQGMNTGIQDAYNLGWKLAAVVKQGATAPLDTYEAERRPIALEVLALSNARLKQTIDQKTIPTQRDAITSQLGVNYRGSVLARDDRSVTARIRAGDRAPDTFPLETLAGTLRLFDLLRGTQFVLLLFGNTRETFEPHADLRCIRVVEKATQRDEIVDAKGLLLQTFEGGDNTLVLIRPDGYIGAISDRGDRSFIREYLAEFGSEAGML